MAVGQDTHGLSPFLTKLSSYRVSFFSSNTKLMGGKWRNFRGFRLARGSCVEHFNDSVLFTGISRQTTSVVSEMQGSIQSTINQGQEKNPNP